MVQFSEVQFIYFRNNFNVNFNDLPEDLLGTPLILAKSVIHSIQGGHASWTFLKSLQLTTKLMVFTPFQGCQFNLQQSFPDINLAEISYSNLKYLARKFYLEK